MQIRIIGRYTNALRMLQITLTITCKILDGCNIKEEMDDVWPLMEKMVRSVLTGEHPCNTKK